MKFLFMIFILNSLIYSQWKNQTINLLRGDYMSVYMLSNSVGYIAGNILLKTTDGGNTWNQQSTSADQEQIFDIKFLDDSLGFAKSLTNNKIVFYKTYDGGKFWEIDNKLDSISSSNGISFNDISFSIIEDSTIIWCAGYSSNPASGFVYYSIDRSKTWKRYENLPTFNTYNTKITFVNSSTGFFSTGSELYRTIDGGKNWQKYSFDGIGMDYFLNLQLFDSDTGYFFAQRQSTFFSPLFIGKTFNGGESWTVDSTAHGFFSYLTPLVIIYFANPNLGFAVDWTKHSVLRTKDGGSNWTEYASPNPAPLFSIHSHDGKNVVAAGPSSHILVSNDSGLTWNDLTPPAKVNFNYIKYFSNNFIIAFDGSNMYHSVDSCNTWTKRALPTGLDICIAMLDSMNGWIADDSSRIYKTSDSGITWKLQREFNYLDPNTTLDPLKGIHFFNKDIGCSVGGNGYITATANGGKAWNSKISHTSNTLYDIFVASKNKAWAVGEGGTIIVTSDSCKSWSFQTCPVNVTLRKVAFIDTLNGYILGDNGIILKTSNGGVLWQLESSPSSSLNSIEFVDNQMGWVIANNGKIFRTLDGGNQWESQESGVQSNLINMDFINNYSGIIVGENGIILTTSNGGVTSSLENENPNSFIKTFELQQNFPNPFNPTTTISFSIPNDEKVLLKVYDILGKEVAVLVNEERPAGKYEVNFSATDGASSLASGVYIYKLQAGSFTAYKKLMLLK